ncbi:hypothetical protein PT974_12349 [Cladobotryum mycophilum]|uniref:Uncharacterized protein n=1 Tax=Cladobotryum mycophilum TaxID=491253 RepID=A0ABR0S7R6_9HYPO
MPSSRSSRSVSSKSSSSSSRTDKPRGSVQDLIDTLTTHRVNTLTDLCRIERIAASCDNEDDARAFQQPMTSAWVHYVSSNSLLTELRGFTRNFPFSSDILDEAHRRVRCDPGSNRSWNLAWLCLTRMRDDGLVVMYAAVEAAKPEMWGGKMPTGEEMGKLAQCFEKEWTQAIETMLRHWTSPPTWY